MGGVVSSLPNAIACCGEKDYREDGDIAAGLRTKEYSINSPTQELQLSQYDTEVKSRYKEAKPLPPPQFVGAKGTQISAFLNYLNDIRQHPAKYADRIQALYVAQCDDYQGTPFNRVTQLLHNEGWEVFAEAINFLRKVQPIGPVSLEYGLCACAHNQANHCARLGEPSLTGMGGGSYEQRILQFGRYTKYNGGCGENCGQHIDHDPEKWVLDYVIDEGNPNRGHRENIFNANYTKVGLGTSQSADGKWFTTMDFAYDCYCSNAISGEMKYSIGLG